MAADMQPTAAAMAAADKTFVVPPVDSDGYVEVLLELCRRERVDALMSLHDVELMRIAERRDEFEALGVNVIVSDHRVTDLCYDKWKTVAFARQIGIEAPECYTSLVDAQHAILAGTLTLPVVVKPRWGSASIGLEFPATLDELEWTYHYLASKIRRLSPPKATDATNPALVVIQENIEGVEFGLDVLNDLGGSTVAVYAKEKLAMRAGETDKAVLRQRPDLEAIGSRIGAALRHRGNLDCDLIEREGRAYLLDLNPRFGGGYPFTHQSGGNFVAAILGMIRGENPNPDHFRRSYGRVYAKCDVLVRVGDH